jgi:hypothetical protein
MDSELLNQATYLQLVYYYRVWYQHHLEMVAFHISLQEIKYKFILVHNYPRTIILTYTIYKFYVDYSVSLNFIRFLHSYKGGIHVFPYVFFPEITILVWIKLRVHTKHCRLNLILILLSGSVKLVFSINFEPILEVFPKKTASRQKHWYIMLNTVS